MLLSLSTPTPYMDSTMNSSNSNNSNRFAGRTACGATEIRLCRGACRILSSSGSDGAAQCRPASLTRLVTASRKAR